MIGKPKPVKSKRAKRTTAKSERKQLEARLEKLCREMCVWRDGGCILRNIDGGRCSTTLQWGHFIARRMSAYHVFFLGGSFLQCSAHNLLHHHGDQIFIDFYLREFGLDAYHAFQADVWAHRYQKPEIWELREWIEEYEGLLAGRPVIYDTPSLIRLGYYGKFPQNFNK